MKRFVSAVFLCGSLLAVGSVGFLRSAEAKEDVVLQLLGLPAPPPPNPLVSLSARRDKDFYSKSKPPADDAPIEDLMDYWSRQGVTFGTIDYNVKPSPRVLGRLLAEIRSNPEKASQFLGLFADEPEGARLIKDIYENMLANPSSDREELATMRAWLVNNSPFFSNELEQKAAKVRDDREYIDGHEELIALARQDWNRAAPLVNRLYNDLTQPNTRVAALWALYRHANDEGSISDTDRYREELMDIVEDRSASNAMRDLALDALVAEREWPGRDEWYFSLLGDETLANLEVNGSTNTGLTTLIMASPVEKYKDRMIELAASDNQTIKNAAVRNLLVMLEEGPDEAIVTALIPWLLDPKWATVANDSGRSAVARALTQYKIPDSVPGLIHLLNEKPPRPENADTSSGRAWTSSNTTSVITNSTATILSMEEPPPRVPSSSGFSNSNTKGAAKYYDEDHYPLRVFALSALVTQADMRAVPALRRLLNTTSDYQLSMAITAMLTSGGFTIPEQVDALVATARAAAISDSDTNGRQLSLQQLIGSQLARMGTVSDDLVRAVISRMDSLEQREPVTAEGLRRIVQRWNGPAVTMMMLRDLKTGKSNTEAVIKLLAIRQELREKQSNEVFDLRTGNPIEIGIAGCILEDTNDMASLLSGNDSAATAAMLACARLIRAELPVATITPLLKSPERTLALAAERYLLSEDSPDARNAVLALYPNAAKITGATTYFEGEASSPGVFGENLSNLFTSVSPYYASVEYPGSAIYQGNFSEIEERLRKEVVADKDLLGVYSYEDFNVRIYAGRAVFSIREDEARYRERVLSNEEFDYLKGMLAYYRVDALPPFLSCSECAPRQLLMLGRNGGRRIFVKTAKMPELFAGLDSFFAQASQSPLKLKYTAGKELPGLEVLFAEDGMAAETVWKNGPEIRLLITNWAVRENLDIELQKAVEQAVEVYESSSEQTEGDLRLNPWRMGQEMRAKREYEGIDWFALANLTLAGQVPIPPGFDLPLVRDSLSVPAIFERWKARAGDLEIRADYEGLYKVRGGSITKIGTGQYRNPIVTPNGRWLIVNKYGDEGNGLIRVNLQTGREYPVDLTEQPADMGIVFIPSINRFLLGSIEYNDYHGEYEGETESHAGQNFPRPDYSQASFLLLDPETGAMRDAPGEYRPLTHQTFRQLQPSGKPNEFWAAIPDKNKNETVVGIYNAAVFGFKTVLKVPTIQFDSLDMWVDQGKFYFVYKGHLLAAPMPAT